MNKYQKYILNNNSFYTFLRKSVYSKNKYLCCNCPLYCLSWDSFFGSNFDFCCLDRYRKLDKFFNLLPYTPTDDNVCLIMHKELLRVIEQYRKNNHIINE